VTIRAVTFDCWGTLLVDGPGSDERYKNRRLGGIEDALKRFGIEPGRLSLSQAYDASLRRLAATTWDRNRDVPVKNHVTLLLEAVDPTLPGQLLPAQLAELVEAYTTPALQAPPKVDPDARSALEWLADQGIAVGVVSNVMRTPGRVLAQILERAGLPPFKVLAFSDQYGIRKPDPAMFRLALRRVDVAPEHAVHVGDDPVLDVEGALDAGMAVIQVAPEGQARAPVKPDAVIRGLSEVPAAIERLASITAA